MWDVLAKTSAELQHVFILGGLAMLLKSQEAIKAGWPFDKTQMAKLKKEIDLRTQAKEDPNTETFFPG